MQWPLYRLRVLWKNYVHHFSRRVSKSYIQCWSSIQSELHWLPIILPLHPSIVCRNWSDDAFLNCVLDFVDFSPLCLFKFLLYNICFLLFCGTHSGGKHENLNSIHWLPIIPPLHPSIVCRAGQMRLLCKCETPTDHFRRLALTNPPIQFLYVCHNWFSMQIRIAGNQN